MRRGKLYVLADILEAVETEEKMTNVMYKSRTTWMSLKKHLDFLARRGLVEARDDASKGLGRKRNLRKRYCLTDKGRKLLQHINEIRMLLGEEQ